jgi:hypothetical protein
MSIWFDSFNTTEDEYGLYGDDIWRELRKKLADWVIYTQRDEECVPGG